VGVTALGAAALLVLLSAGFAAVVELVCGLGSAAVMLAARGASEGRVVTPGGRLQQAGALGAALLLAVLLYAGWRGSFFPGAYPGGGFNAAAVGRLLFDRDALLGVAAIGLLAAAAAGAGVWAGSRR
jgi:hypothetical protein